MTGLNKEQQEIFLKESLRELIKERRFLREHGWKKKNKDKNCTLWISPKGEEYHHDMGFFGDHTRAFNKAKHDIVLDSGFIQFQVQVFNDEDHPKNLRGTEEPIDFFFPCIKDGKIYWYDNAVSLAVYGIESNIYTDRFSKVKELLETLDLTKIKHKDIIRVYEYYNKKSKEFGFHL